MRHFIVSVLVSLVLAVHGFAANVVVVPDRAPAGARVLAVGEGFATATVSVETSAGQTPAVVIARSATLLEFVVPSNAITGPIEVKSNGASVGTATLTITSAPPFVRVATLASALGSPVSVAISLPDGRIVITDASKHQIKILQPSGTVLRVIGSGKPGFRDGKDAEAQFKDPTGVAIDPITGSVYVADSGNHAIRKITTDSVATIAGSGKPGLRDARGSDALFKQPTGIAVGRDGAVFIADTGNHAIRRVTSAGDVATIAGTGAPGYRDGAAHLAQFHGPGALAVVGEIVYVADTQNHAVRALRVSDVTTVAGTTHPGSLDGTAALAEFHAPSGIAVADDGAVYVADTRNHTLRTISGGIVRTLAGIGKPGHRDGEPDTSAFHEPRGLAYAGALYAADTKNGALRVVYSGVVGSAVYPAQGDPQGGETIRVFGAGFVPGATTVSLAGIASAVTYVTSTELLVTTPPHPVGTVDIAITTPGGTAILDAAYEYVPPFLSLTINPDAAMLSVDDVLQFSATGTSSDGTMADLTSQVTWSSSAPLVASIGASGLLHALSPGEATITATYGDLSASAKITVLNPEPPLVALAVVPSNATLDVDQALQLAAIGTADDGTTRDVTLQAAWSSSAPGVGSVSVTGLARALSPGEVQIAATLDMLSAAAAITVRTPEPLPPDPATTATPLRTTELTSFAEATRFLYSGESPIQTGVAAGTIVEMRASVTRGVVRTRDGVPLGGVTVLVADHPEYGSTLTRADGGFDLVVNGGTTYTLSFEKSGYITAHRKMYAPWQDFAIVDDVAMIRFDTAATTITTGAAQVQIARASLVTDSDGPRRATMLVPSGTLASIVNADGTTTPLASLTLRMTEYTVGARGPDAMPATLPPQSGYTYCVELSADEAIGAAGVTFTRPLAFYVENFLGFPIGGVVPSAFYDRTRAAWIPSDDGRVVAITAIADSMAALDTNGDGIADPPTTLSELGIDDAERTALATVYSAGTSLWRVPVTHFSPCDLNWPYGPVVPEGETAGPPPDPPKWSESIDDPTMCPGSIVRCDNQTLGETMPITGTPFHLVYESGRVRGRAAERNFELTFTGGTSVRGVKRIDVRIEVAGVVEERSFSPGTTESMNFAWNGRDTYDRLMTGAVDAHVSVSYVYDAAYQVPEGERTFGTLSGVPLTIPGRETVSITSRWTVPLGGLRAESAQLGGWTLSPHHLYDYSRRTLLLGNGEQQSADVRNLQQFEITTAAGTLQCCGDGSGVATRTRLDAPFQIDVGADGSVYLNEWEEIRRITPDGLIERIAGTGRGGFNGDGPATTSQIDANSSLVIGSDGAIYIPDRGNFRVRRIKNGMMTTVAGNGEPPDIAEPLEENVPANQTRVNPADVAVAPDGTLYIADAFRYIRRVTPDGLIRTIAGGGTERGDGVPARRFRFNNDLEGLALAPDGSIYFAEEGPNGANLRRIGPDGTVGTVIESGPHCATGTEPFDGPVATACLEKVWFLRVGPDGSVYIPDQIGSRVRMITPDGVIRTIAGNGVSGSSSQLRPRGVATGEMLGQPFGAAVGPDGTVYATDAVPEVVRRITPTLARFTAGETVIPASDGSELYVFSGSRHLRTLDALTGAVLLTFAYDADGRLTAISDFDGKVTAVERSGGTISAIVAPGGQRTSISVDTSGYLRTTADPAGQTYTLIHTDGGLLTELRTPRLFTHSYTYDDDGRLEKDLSPDGRSLTLTRSGAGDDWSVTTRTSLGLTMTKDRQRLSDGSGGRVSLLPGGLSVVTAIGSSGASVVTLPDGLIARSTPKADPRLGTSAPLFSRELVFPSGLTLTSSHTRTVTLSDPDDSLSLTLQADSLNVNGRVTTTTFDALLRQMRITTPAGRTSLVSTDGALRPLVIDAPGLAQTQIGYTDGLVASVSAGNRFVSYQYDAKRRLQSQTDSLNRTVSFGYDDADRVTSQTLPDGRVVVFGYDAAGNLTSVTPPSRPNHAMTLTPGDQLASYHAPAVAGAGNITQYAYDLDRKLTAITRPDQSTITVSHDSHGRVIAWTAQDAGLGVTWDTAGRVGTLTSTSGTLAYAYDGSLLTSATMSGAIAGTVAYTYDSSLRLSGESVNNTTVPFGWDNDDLLIQAGALTLTRRGDNGLLSGTSVGGVTDAFTYNELGEVLTYNAGYVGSAMVAATYSRDRVGRITGATETILGVTAVRGYEYDVAGRLERVTSGGATLSTYGYDDNGNRTSHVRSMGTEVGSYDAQDRLIAYGDSTYTFTANGDLQARTLAGATTTYDYDAFGNLTEVVLPGGTTIEYVVDAQNRRVGKKRNGVLEKGWLYGDQLRIVAEFAPDGAIVSRFVYGSRANTPDYMIRNGVTYRILSDHLGSPRLVVSTSDGTIAERIDYDEFGNVTSDTTPGFQPFGFAGGLYDSDARLVRFGARDYDPHMGRWTAKDPIGFAGGDANLYGYAMNDPVNLIDPSGLLFGGTVDAGEAYGQSAVVYYADILTDPDTTWYEKFGAALGGGFAALWTPCTSDATFTTLSTAAGAGGWARQPYWRYLGPNSRPNSPWLVRGWRPPYGNNYARAKDALQMPHMPTGVQRVNVPGMAPVRGPRPAIQNPQWGSGGGSEYARGWNWPQ